MRAILVGILMLCLWACEEKVSEKAPTNILKLDMKMPARLRNKLDRQLDSARQTWQGVWGTRMQVSGDFDGDGETEVLREHFVDESGKPIPKLIRGLEEHETEKLFFYGQEFRQPSVFLLAEDAPLDSLLLQSGNQILGLAYLSNPGDLDQDGRDDILLVLDKADWSSLNTAMIFSWRQGAWQKRHGFMIHESFFRDFPTELNLNGAWDQPSDQFVELADQFDLTPLVRHKDGNLIEVRAFDLLAGKGMWEPVVLP
ncbi:MAG: hypothetical protein AAF206_01410 [Bacteroidota bacterium]